jgi:hypothetical protein
MWRLMMTNAATEWVEAGDFETLTAAARRIRELEDYPVTGVFLEAYCDTERGSDDEALSHFEHKGRRALYVVKRQVN